jgi:pyruvate dehydrogenase E2 component (dihydrolipoamide acetyltransferase)
MFNVKFADIGEGIHEGVLLKIFVKDGQTVAEGEDLFTLETDKVNAEIPSPVSGTVKSVQHKVGDKVHVGDIIVVIDDGESGVRSNMSMDGAGEEDLSAMSSDKSSSSESEPISEEKGASVVGQIEVSSQLIASSQENYTETKAESPSHKVLATPVARQMAKDLGVDITKIKGTGPVGRVMKADIKAAAADQSSTLGERSDVVSSAAREKQLSPRKVVPGEAIERIPMTMLRKTIAENMEKSRFTIPHTTVMDEGDVTELVNFKREAKTLAEEEGVKLTYLAFFIKAVVLGLKAYPYLNAEVDMASHEIILKHDCHIGIAVDTKEGLMVPVVKHADRLSIFEIAKEIERLSDGARDKTLTLEDLKGGTFSITNYGSVGSSFGVPIIKYPEAGILGVGAIVKKPVVVSDEVVIRTILPLSLSFDHRIIDGADAGRFVSYVKDLLSDPKRLMLK